MRPRLRLVRGGGSVELRVNGALFSSIRSGGPTTHPVWEALAAPLLAVPESRRRAILLLGLGGGSVARAARALWPHARIVAVDRDRAMVAAARRHFGLGELDVEVVVADARAFLEHDPRRYDAVLEDLFVGSSRDLRKPAWLPEPGLRLCLARLSEGGLLACNTIHEGAAFARALRAHVPRVVQVGVRGFYNRILVAGRPTPDATALRAVLARDVRLRQTLPQLELRTLVR